MYSYNLIIFSYRNEQGELQLMKTYRVAIKKGQENKEISMKSLIFNFEKYFKEKNKIPYLLSEKAITERSTTLRLIF